MFEKHLFITVYAKWQFIRYNLDRLKLVLMVNFYIYMLNLDN